MFLRIYLLFWAGLAVLRSLRTLEEFSASDWRDRQTFPLRSIHGTYGRHTDCEGLQSTSQRQHR